MILQRKKIKVAKANSKGDGALRIGLPKSFAEVLQVGAGDRVEYRLNYIDGEIVITLVKCDE